MGGRPRITVTGRRRVAAALDRTGLLLVQGQAENPSVADLLAGGPVTTRGYSWDYVPAWDLTDEYERTGDVAVVKLFRGRRTLVHRRRWPDVDFHTHEPALFPWSAGVISRAQRRRRPLTVDAAISTLYDVAATDRVVPAARLFPVAKLLVPPG